MFMNRSTWIGCLAVVAGLAAGAARAADVPGDISAPDAHTAAKAGKLVLVDIRTPGEWRETGVPQGAKRIDMLDPQFESKLRAALSGKKDAQVAIICRTGNRSTHVQRWLRSQGYSSVLNVKEGMAGSGAGPGWIRRGLPVEACRNC